MDITQIDKEAEPGVSSTVITLEVAPPAAQVSNAVVPEPQPEQDPQVS
jgi:hypothetical protein